MPSSLYRGMRRALVSAALFGFGLSAGSAAAQGSNPAASVHKVKPASTASAKGNKAIMLRFYDEAFNGGNLAVIDQLVASDMVEHNPFPGQAQGIEGIKQVVTMLRTAFPDVKQTVDDMIAEGDKVVARITMTGTHKGAFMGIPPTGKKITVTGIDIVRFVNGKAVDHWGNEDDLGMMQQLGALPSMEKPGEGKK